MIFHLVIWFLCIQKPFENMNMKPLVYKDHIHYDKRLISILNATPFEYKLPKLKRTVGLFCFAENL